MFSGLTNHSLGFSSAFQVLKEAEQAHKSGSGGKRHNFVFYISKGLLSSLIEAGQVLQTIGVERLRLGIDLQINTFPVIDR